MEVGSVNPVWSENSSPVATIEIMANPELVEENIINLPPFFKVLP